LQELTPAVVFCGDVPRVVEIQRRLT
jgi:hypothetical protein